MALPRLLFVESNTTGTGMLALRLCDRLGLAPVLLTGRPDRYAGLAGTGAEVVVCDTNDPAALAGAVDALAALPGGLAGITTTSEFYLVPAASLAAAHGLVGNPPEAMATCRDKSRTRAVLATAGVGQPAFAAVRDAAEVPAAVEKVGLPCVVKPADDSGSNGVLRCGTAEEAVEHAAAVLAVTENVRGQPTAGVALVEAYLPGPEVSVEVMTTGGRSHVVGVTAREVTDGPHLVETGHLFPATGPVGADPVGADPPDVDPAGADPVGADPVGADPAGADPAAAHSAAAAAAVRALAVTGVRVGATHVEVKLTPDGPAVVEINARLAGGMIPELVLLATGIELLEQQLRAYAGLPVSLEPVRSAYAGIRFLTAPAAGVLRAVTGAGAARAVPGVDRVTLIAAPGRPVRPAENAYDRLGYVIAVAPGPEQVRAALDEAVAHIGIEVEGGPGA
ncbi:MAG TPA: ATP-grasp domain-containing protein [Mycobacteriales bacterium]